MPPEVSVIIPCYQAVGYLPRCIGSLAAQSLDADRFEAVLIFNGPSDGGEQLAAELLQGAGIPHQILHSDPGAGRARNVGIASARAPWTTLLDADDELSPHFLELMLSSATDPTVVPVAAIVDESYDRVETPWWFNATLLASPGPQPPEPFYPHLTLNAGKLIPTAAMRHHRFNEELRSGEDIALYCTLFDAEGFVMNAAPAIAGARYRRHVTPTSVSRQSHSFDFMVTHRLAVIRELNRQLIESPGPLDGVRRISIASQAHFMRRYLRQNPGDAAAVTAAIAEDPPAVFAPLLRPTPPRQAVVCREFAPSGTAESRALVDWLIDSGQEWQMVSTATTDEMDWRLPWVAGTSVGRHDRIPVPPDVDSERSFREFIDAALASLADMGELEVVATFGPWRAAHIAGALHAERRGTRWEPHATPPLHDAELTRDIDRWRTR